MFPKKVIERHSSLIGNFVSLYILKIANILIPLVTLPYLVRVLGVEKFGVISFAQVFAMFFVMLVDFGFNLSIVRLISVNSDNNKKVSEIFSSVIIIKSILLIISALIYYLIVVNITKFSSDKSFYFCMFGIVVGQGFFPTWLFQGMQRMKYITILNISVKLFFLMLIFALIHSEKDYLLYPILLSLGYIGILPFAFYLAWKNFNLQFFIPSVHQLLYYTKYSSHFFASRIAVRFYEGGGLFAVGLISPELITGYYAIADKLRAAITSLYSPISQALYPYIAKNKNIKMYKKIFKLINILNVIGLTIFFIFTKPLMELVFNGTSDTTIMLMRIFIFVMLLDVPSILLGYPMLGAFGHTNYVNYSLVITAIIYISLLLVFYLIGLLTVKVIALLYILAVIIELGLRVFGVYKYKLWSGNV